MGSDLIQAGPSRQRASPASCTSLQCADDLVMHEYAPRKNNESYQCISGIDHVFHAEKLYRALINPEPAD